MANEELIKIEVVYALPSRQKIIAVEIPRYSTVSEAIEYSGIRKYFGELNKLGADMPSVGIFGKLIKDPRERIIHEGQRVEIYRPLIIDPKKARANRAALVLQRKELRNKKKS
jgi:putative ubiquitin-RnfH superfamily antitoxin RatB of RatAB toxin-antitoxin module